MVFNTICSRCFMVLASEIDSKIEVFSILFRKRRFCQNHCFTAIKPPFFMLRASQNRWKISAKSRSKKSLPKNLPKIDFGTILASQKPPKIHPKSKKVAPETDSKKRLQGLTGRGGASTHPTPEVKPKRPPESHPFT